MFPLHIMKQQWKLDKYFIGSKNDILLPVLEPWKLGDLWQLNLHSIEEETPTYHKQAFVHRKPKTLPHLIPAVKTSQLQSLWLFLWPQCMCSIGMYYFPQYLMHNGITYFVIFGSLDNLQSQCCMSLFTQLPGSCETTSINLVIRLISTFCDFEWVKPLWNLRFAPF